MAEHRSVRVDAALVLTGSGVLLVSAGTVGVLGRLALRHLLAHSVLAVCCGIGAIAWGFSLQGRRRRELTRAGRTTRPVPPRPLHDFETMPVPMAVPAPVVVPLRTHRVHVDAWIGPPRALRGA